MGKKQFLINVESIIDHHSFIIDAFEPVQSLGKGGPSRKYGPPLRVTNGEVPLYNIKRSRTKTRCDVFAS